MVDINDLLAYKTSRKMKVAIWQIGALYYALISCIIFAFAYTLFLSGGYARSEQARGTFNPWGEDADGSFLATSHVDPASLSYCSAPTHDFVYSTTTSTLSPSAGRLTPSSW